MSRPEVIYTPRTDATPEAEVNVLAAVYALAIQKYQECKEAAERAAPDDVRRDHGAHTAKQNYT